MTENTSEPLPSTQPPVEPVAVPAPPPLRPWGFWATMGFGLTLCVAEIIFGIILLAALFLLSPSNPGQNTSFLEFTYQAKNNGYYLSISGIFAGATASLLIFLFAWLRQSMPVREYLGLAGFSFREFKVGLIGLLVLIIIEHLVTWLAGPLEGDDFAATMLKTAEVPVLIYIAMVVAAPISEELFFRSFILQGIRYSVFGAWLAVGFTAAAWAVIHTQYHPIIMVTIFLGGLFFGFMRVRTGSVILVIILHALWNLISLVETIIGLRLST